MAKIGLPDDYRRCSIHGKKLAENLKRFEKKSPELLFQARAGCRDSPRQDPERDRTSLPGNSVANYRCGPERFLPLPCLSDLAVPQRLNSALTPPSQNSTTNWVPVLGDYEDGEEHYQSPISCAPPDQSNPYHWHIPYPHQQQLMPASPDPDAEDDRTVIMQPAGPKRQPSAVS